MRPFSARSRTSQKLIGESRGGSDATSNSRLIDAGRRSGSFTPHSQTWVSSSNST